MEHHADFLRYMATIADQIEATRARRPDGLGWTVQHVRPTDPRNRPYTYTVGLSVYHRPELVVFSLPETLREKVLELAVEHVLAGPPAPSPNPGLQIELFPHVHCRMSPHPRPQRLRIARTYIEGLPGYTLSAWIVNLC